MNVEQAMAILHSGQLHAYSVRTPDNLSLFTIIGGTWIRYETAEIRTAQIENPFQILYRHNVWAACVRIGALSVVIKTSYSLEEAAEAIKSFFSLAVMFEDREDHYLVSMFANLQRLGYLTEIIDASSVLITETSMMNRQINDIYAFMLEHSETDSPDQKFHVQYAKPYWVIKDVKRDEPLYTPSFEDIIHYITNSVSDRRL